MADRDANSSVEEREARALFRARGLRCTQQRLRVLIALRSTKRHPTAEELFHLARADNPGVSRATVYNTLEALTAGGLARRLPARDGAGGACRYDADTTDHVHIVHADGTVQDLPEDMGDAILDCLPDGLLREVERRTGVRVARVSVELHQVEEQQ